MYSSIDFYLHTALVNKFNSNATEVMCIKVHMYFMPIECIELSPCVLNYFIINVTTAKVKTVFERSYHTLSSSLHGTINIQ